MQDLLYGRKLQILSSKILREDGLLLWNLWLVHTWQPFSPFCKCCFNRSAFFKSREGLWSGERKLLQRLAANLILICWLPARIAGWARFSWGLAGPLGLTNFQNLLNLITQANVYRIETKPNETCPESLSVVDFTTQLASWLVSERLRGFMLGHTKAINK